MKSQYRVFFSLIFLSFALSLVIVYKLHYKDKTGGYVDNKSERRSLDVSKSRLSLVEHVEIWGKASIANYLWEHILQGRIQETPSRMVQLGNLEVNGINFTYRYGPGIIQTTVPNDVKHLVLVLNGRSEEKIIGAKMWLDFIPQYRKLKKLAIVLLGDEMCNNGWLLPYMRSRGGVIDVVFLVYDSTLIDDNEFYQWPLGVAVYRRFPDVLPNQVDVKSSRTYLCTFMGTIYENSSRETLLRLTQSSQLENECFFRGRDKWQPQETSESLDTYISSLCQSDLALSPVGKNSECYRIYEAMSFGSVPVIEDVRTPGNCSQIPFRLLKSYKAPVLYIQHWSELLHILQKEERLTLNQKNVRRVHVLQWYKRFKLAMKKLFVNVIINKFIE